MKIIEKIKTLNEGRLELHTYPYPKNAVSYESLFIGDYVTAVYTGDELKKIIIDNYSGKPRWADNCQAVAKTRDGNFWFYKETGCTNGIPLWWWEGDANNRLKTANL